MPKLPQVKSKEAIKVFEKVGFTQEHTRGSHYIMRRPMDKRKLSIPIHGSKPLGRGLLLSLLKDADIARDEFINLLK